MQQGQLEWNCFCKGPGRAQGESGTGAVEEEVEEDEEEVREECTVYTVQDPQPSTL